MMGIRLKFLVCVAVLFLSVQLFSISALAYDIGSISGATNVSGAKLPSYSKCEQIDVVDQGADKSGKKDSSKAIQKALDYAKDKASDSVQIKVFVPKGEYKITKTLRIYSNTWLYLEEDAVIKKSFGGGCMLKNTMQFGGSGYDMDRNILIEGGKWDGNTANYDSMAYFSNIRIGHARNVLFYNVEVANNKNGHHMELGGIDGLTIENCSFHGYSGYLAKEAIQLDILNNKEIFVGYEPFDDTAMNNVLIKNNDFYDLSRGIGSHSAVVGKYYTNILITENRFKNISDVALIMYNYKNCTIEKNNMTNVGMGVDFRYMSDNGSVDFFKPVIGYDSARKNINDDANTIIRQNEITTRFTNNSSTPFGVRVYGKKVKGTKLPEYNYRVQGVNISNNNITSAAQAVILDDTVDCVVSGNNLSRRTDTDCDVNANLLDVVRSRYVTISRNLVSNSSSAGIKIDGGKVFNVDKNTVVESNGVGILGNSISESSFTNNNVKKAKDNGIMVKNSNDIDISNNVIDFVEKSGIVFADNSSENNRCKNNSLTSAGKFGVCVTSQSQTVVNGNVFSTNNKNIGVGEGSVCKITRPEDVLTNDVTDETAAINWRYQQEADGYNIYRKQGQNSEYELVSDQKEPVYRDEDVESKTTYFYKIEPYIGGKNMQKGESFDDIYVKTKSSIKRAYVELEKEVGYTGRARNPEIKVVAYGWTLVNGIDYNVEYTNNTNIGKAQVKIVGAGEYCGELDTEFSIVPAFENLSAPLEQTNNLPSNSNNQVNQSYEIKCDLNNHVSLANDSAVKTSEQIVLDSFYVRRTFLISSRTYRTIDATRIYGIWTA